MMTPRRRIQNLIEGKPADRTPFCPAVYEHKAALIGVKPSELCRDAGLFEKAIIREVETYEPDVLVIGCDVYNVEAEASGCRVFYPDSNDVPAVRERAVHVGDDLSRLRVPDPLNAGRMPLHLEVGRHIQGRFGRERLVRGALSAPFSIACELVGPEPLLMAMLDRPDWVDLLLSFTSEITKAYGKAFVERGLGVILFDSHASPPMTSPALYKKMILSPTADVIRYFRFDLGVPLVPYILGGDTTPLLEEIIATGANNLLCDHKADLSVFVERLKDEPVLLRANIDPGFLTTQPLEAIRARAREVLSVGRRHPRFLMGTGILPYDIAPERVIAVREAIDVWDG
ncbi:MAG: uroporphyrinogen decarboxylase family protein [Candidatus Aminicenantales bacterium]